MKLQQGVEQIIRIGVLLEHTTNNPCIPVTGAELNWFWWRYLIKSDGTVVDIINHTWSDIPNCDGCYFLTLTATDTNKLGPLVIYIMDETGLGKPIFIEFDVVAEPHAQKG